MYKKRPLFFRLIGISLFCVVLSVTASVLSTSSTDIAYIPDLEELVPDSLNSWQKSSLAGLVTPAEWREEEGMSTLYRTYKNKDGVFITLVIAYGAALGDAVRMHQPEVCYKSQGYAILAQTRSRLAATGTILPLHHMEADNNIQKETVTFWMRAGNGYANGQISQQIANILSGSSRGATSTLVRLSTTGALTPEVKMLHDMFIQELIREAPTELIKIISIQTEKAPE